MANIVDYLAAIAARTEVLAVGTHEVVDTDSAGVSLCQVPMTEINTGGTAAMRKTLMFYVTDLGGPSETCYDFKKELTPELSPAEKFADNAMKWLFTQGHANVAEIVYLDETRKKMRVRCHVETSGTEFQTREAIVWKDNGVPIQIRFLP